MYYKRAFAYQVIGRYGEAVIDYTTYIQYEQDHKDKGYVSRGLVYTEIKRYDQALKDIERANKLSLQPSKYYIYCLGRAQMAASQYEEAQATLSHLVRICHDECSTERGTFESYFIMVLLNMNSKSIPMPYNILSKPSSIRRVRQNGLRHCFILD